ncbi:hypothetical protein PR048_007888 [Dryococelus australis]|uniref:HTH psq-type domain-containing protein n=1 Tax=Dryococelus australis TaxID=614101 RepID=A0ABQ9HX56_9NEOP|nr:hypothetical protein PR048_007888 [Dryococelus australis]
MQVAVAVASRPSEPRASDEKGPAFESQLFTCSVHREQPLRRISNLVIFAPMTGEDMVHDVAWSRGPISALEIRECRAPRITDGRGHGNCIVHSRVRIDEMTPTAMAGLLQIRSERTGCFKTRSSVGTVHRVAKRMGRNARARENWRHPRNLNDQRHCPARFPLAKICKRHPCDRSRFALLGGEGSLTATPLGQQCSGVLQFVRCKLNKIFVILIFRTPMVQKYKRKTWRQGWNAENMRRGLTAVKEGMLFKSAARQFNVPVTALKRRRHTKARICTM